MRQGDCPGLLQREERSGMRSVAFFWPGGRCAVAPRQLRTARPCVRRRSARDEQVGQADQQGAAPRVLRQPQMAHLGVADASLHARERMLHLPPHRRARASPPRSPCPTVGTGQSTCAARFSVRLAHPLMARTSVRRRFAPSRQTRLDQTFPKAALPKDRHDGAHARKRRCARLGFGCRRWGPGPAAAAGGPPRGWRRAFWRWC